MIPSSRPRSRSVGLSAPAGRCGLAGCLLAVAFLAVAAPPIPVSPNAPNESGLNPLKPLRPLAPTTIPSTVVRPTVPQVPDARGVQPGMKSPNAVPPSRIPSGGLNPSFQPNFQPRAADPAGGRYPPGMTPAIPVPGGGTLVVPGTVQPQGRVVPGATVFVPQTPTTLPQLPDLVVRSFATTGGLEFAGNLRVHSLPVSIVVANVGGAPAGSFRIGAVGAADAGGAILSLAVDRQGEAGYGLVSALDVGEARLLTGRVLIPREFQGRRISITVHADSTFGEEFSAAFGRVRESNEGNNSSRIIVLNVPLTVPDQPIAAVAPAAPHTSRPETWTIGLSRLQIHNRNEGSGDEPYFLCIGFRAQFGVEGSARAFRQGSPREFVVDLGVRRPVDVPDYMGRVTFENVRRITWEEYAAGTMPEVLGVAFVAMEHDASDFADVRRIVERAIEPLQREVEQLVARGRIIGRDPGGAVAAASDRVRGRVEPTVDDKVWKALEAVVNPLTLDEVADPDDFVGVKVAVFLAVDQSYEVTVGTRGGTLPVPRLHTANWTAHYLGTRSDPCDWAVSIFATKGSDVVR